MIYLKWHLNILLMKWKEHINRKSSYSGFISKEPSSIYKFSIEILGAFNWILLKLDSQKTKTKTKKNWKFIFAFKMLVYLFMYIFTYKLCKLLFNVYLIENLFK